MIRKFPEIYRRVGNDVVNYVTESSQGFTQWRLGRLDPVSREVRPYDDIGFVNVQYCIMPVDCNGTCSVSGQVTVILCKKITPVYDLANLDRSNSQRLSRVKPFGLLSFLVI